MWTAHIIVCVKSSIQSGIRCPYSLYIWWI